MASSSGSSEYRKWADCPNIGVSMRDDADVMVLALNGAVSARTADVLGEVLTSVPAELAVVVDARGMIVTSRAAIAALNTALHDALTRGLPHLILVARPQTSRGIRRALAESVPVVETLTEALDRGTTAVVTDT